MPFRHRAASHLDDACLIAPVQFAARRTGIGADVVADNAHYTIRDIRLDDIGYGGRTDRIAVGNLGMGKPCAMDFIQFKEYLASF